MTLAYETLETTTVEYSERHWVLHEVVARLAHAFGADDNSLKIIAKCMVSLDVLSEILIHYLDNDKLVLGLTTIRIDWENHRILATTPSGNKFEVRGDDFIGDVIGEKFPRVIKHSEDLRQAFGITTIVTHFRFTPATYRNPAAFARLNKFLKTCSQTQSLAWRYPGREQEVVVTGQSATFPELRIVICHHNPQEGESLIRRILTRLSFVKPWYLLRVQK